jgi:hypothetical protein
MHKYIKSAATDCLTRTDLKDIRTFIICRICHDVLLTYELDKNKRVDALNLPCIKIELSEEEYEGDLKLRICQCLL